LGKLLEDVGRVRIRVRPEQMPQAAEILRRLAPDRPLYGIDTGEQAGWFTVNVVPTRASEINQALSEAGIYASGVEPGSDLETLFLEITGAGSPVIAPPVPPS
jgi:hypothetical protein